MMVRLVGPQAGMRVYDPCAGSGGMLVYSREYVEEHGQDPRNLALYGQENNGTTWAISKMNMILHGINNADIANEDTLAAPRHKDESGERLLFDRVPTNPPFSISYARKGMEYAERFSYRFTPGHRSCPRSAQGQPSATLPQVEVASTACPNQWSCRCRSEWGQDAPESAFLAARHPVPAMTFC